MDAEGRLMRRDSYHRATKRQSGTAMDGLLSKGSTNQNFSFFTELAIGGGNDGLSRSPMASTGTTGAQQRRPSPRRGMQRV